MLGRGWDKILDFFIILNLSKIWKNGLFLVITNTTKKAGVFIGTIYIGVDDNGNVVGIPDENKDIYDQKLSSMVTEGIKPSAKQLVTFGYNSDNVLFINVNEGTKKPYYLASTGPKPSGTYIRVGRCKQQLSDEEILFMLMDSMKMSFEKEISENQNLHFTYAVELAKSKNIDFSEREWLALGLKNRHDGFTNLGLLVSDENPIEVKFASYDENLNFKMKKIFSGSILKIADQTLEYANLLNTTSAVIVPYQAQRIETKSYPGVSLREAILNAICHANYLKPSNIKIEFYDDRVEITSPGGILDGTLEEILSGYQTFRNPGLVRVLDKFDYIENFGKGMKRIQEAYENSDKKPSFDVNNTYFRIVLPDLNFYHNSTINSTNNSTIDSTIRLSETQVAILTLIKENKYITTNEISDKLNKELSTIKKSIKVLKDVGILARIGTNRTGYWEILDLKGNFN